MAPPAGEYEAIHDKGTPFSRTLWFSGMSTHVGVSGQYVIRGGGEALITATPGSGLTLSTVTSDGHDWLKVDIAIAAVEFDDMLAGEYFHTLEVWMSAAPLDVIPVVRGPFVLRRDGT